MIEQALQLKAGGHQDLDPQNQPYVLGRLFTLEDREGLVFLLVSIPERHKRRDDVYALLEEHVQRLAASFGKQANIQHRFEQFLSALNERIAKEVKNGAWNFPIGDMDAILGIAADQKMFLSGTGDLCALFVHKQEKGQYQIFNLSRGIRTEQSLPTWEKTFAVVLEGDLHGGDVFCVATQDAQQSLEQAQLLDILTSLPPDGACAKIRQSFPDDARMALFILHTQEPASRPALEKAVQLSEVSVERLNESLEKTTRLLEQQNPGLRSWVFNRLREYFQKYTRNRVPGIKRGMHQVLLRQAGRLLMRILRAGVVTTATLAKKEHRRKQIQRTIARFNTLPQTSKYLALAAVAFFFIFIVSTAAISRGNKNEEDSLAYAASRDRLRGTINQAEGAVIYKDQNQARELFATAATLLDTLPANTPERIAEVQAMRDQVTSALNELRHVIEIKNPALIADLAGTVDGVFGRALLASKDALHLAATDKALYRINPEEKAATRIASGEQIGAPIASAFDENRAYFLDDRPGLVRYDQGTSTLQTLDPTPAPGIVWNDAALYGQRLYVLEQAGGVSQGQVMRLSVNADGTLGNPTPWINSKDADFSDAQGLAIDGAVYVLKADGQIVRFVRGGQTAWKAERADPPVVGARRLRTSPESAYLYTLDPASKRVLVHKKEDGAFVVQYVSESFTDLTDLLVDEKQKSLYLLAGSRVYSISASHLR